MTKTEISCVNITYVSQSHQTPVVQRVSNTLHWINHHLLDNFTGFDSTYPVDSDLSIGWDYAVLHKWSYMDSAIYPLNNWDHDHFLIPHPNLDGTINRATNKSVSIEIQAPDRTRVSSQCQHNIRFITLNIPYSDGLVIRATSNARVVKLNARDT